MANSLPTVNSDAGVWGTELNTWLLGDHTAGGTHAFTSFIPADYGFIAWNYDPAVCSSTVGLTAGTLYLSRLNIRYSATVNALGIGWVAGAGGTLTSGQNFGALIDSTGARVAVTADQTTTWAGSGFFAMTLSGGPFTLAAGFYWAAVLYNGTGFTTAPSLARGTNLTAVSNAGLTAATSRFGTGGTAQTAVPASITPSAIVQGSVSYWCCLL